MNEIWKDIPGYENLYKISNLGRVKSMPKRFRDERIIKQFKCKWNYNIVSLYNKKPKTYKVHSIIGVVFMGGPKEGFELNHIDGNKSNNCIYNLEWVTKSENALHAFKLGLRKKKFGSDNVNNKLSIDQVREIKRLLPNRTNSEIGKQFNVTSQNINNIRKFKTWKYV